jgi:UDP-N-acetylmuramyl pentapeptide synthase
LGHLAGAAGIGVLAVCGPYAEITAVAAREKATVDFESFVFGDTDELCNKLVDIVRDDDIILVKGSRSAGLERAVEKLRELFSR